MTINFSSLISYTRASATGAFSERALFVNSQVYVNSMQNKLKNNGGEYILPLGKRRA